jgi:hypothetical protein
MLLARLLLRFQSCTIVAAPYSSAPATVACVCGDPVKAGLLAACVWPLHHHWLPWCDVAITLMPTVSSSRQLFACIFPAHIALTLENHTDCVLWLVLLLPMWFWADGERGVVAQLRRGSVFVPLRHQWL